MSCVFCDIVKGNIPAKIVAQNEGAIAFLDVNPMSDGHILIIPKVHFKDWSSADEQSIKSVGMLAKEVAAILMDSKLKPWGVNYLSNEGAIAGQAVFHYHLHVIPKYGKAEGFKFSIGTHIVDPLDEVYESIMKAKEKRDKKK